MNEAPVVPASRTRDAGGRFGPAQQLEDLWRHGQRPNIEEFLHRQENLNADQVIAILGVDQWHRWHGGERVPAEFYLQLHPALTTAWAGSFELVSAEFRIRKELGENPHVEEFLERFPQFTAKLHKIESELNPSYPPQTTNLNTPAAVISTAGEVALDRRVTSEWPEVPGYKVLGKLGQGGMGHVYKATQERLNRLVALKIIRKESMSQDPRAVRRFQREAQAAAQLSHPNIIVIYDFNQSGSTYYIAMEFIEGVDLHQLVQDYGPLPLDLASDLILQTASGLQHAHEAGMVHRDIKPSNMMVALPKGGYAQAAPGEAGLRALLQKSLVKILDMGTALLAQSVDADSAKWTQHGTLMGTPDYLAPEQAMDSHAVDIRADIYSLGCTFYYLLTGKAPFGQYPLMKKLMMHQTMLPNPVREFRPEVSPHIEMVVHRLMAKRPEDRFQTPAELVEALTTHQLHTAANGPSSLFALNRGRSLDSPPLPGPDSGTGMDTGRSTGGTNGKHLQRKAAEEETHRPPIADTLAVSSASDSLQLIAALQGGNGWTVALAFAPDRNTLASGTLRGDICLWNFSKGKPSKKAAFQAKASELHSLAYSPDNRKLASGSGSLNGTIRIWDLGQQFPQVEKTLTGHSAPVECLTFSSDGSLLGSGSGDKTVRVWDLAEGKPVERAVFKGHTDTVKSVAFSPDGKTVASGSQDGTVRLWRKGGLWSREMVGLLSGGWGPVQSVAYGPDGNTLAFGCLDQTVQLWDVTADQPRQRAVLQGHSGVVRLVRFLPDGNLATLCDGGRIILWGLSSGKKLRDWQLPRMNIVSATFTFDARYLAAGASDGTIHVFRLYPKRADSSKTKAPDSVLEGERDAGH
ncbi:MAG TPA: serine/threonine-protein kinase [Gemmataceae bacterium]|nr:serine/threonine-protein kinase [Gemmataceae bacterium]